MASPTSIKPPFTMAAQNITAEIVPAENFDLPTNEA